MNEGIRMFRMTEQSLPYEPIISTDEKFALSVFAYCPADVEIARHPQRTIYALRI